MRKTRIDNNWLLRYFYSGFVFFSFAVVINGLLGLGYTLIAHRRQLTSKSSRKEWRNLKIESKTSATINHLSGCKNRRLNEKLLTLKQNNWSWRWNWSDTLQRINGIHRLNTGMRESEMGSEREWKNALTSTTINNKLDKKEERTNAIRKSIIVFN